jgi:hypothetical protein
MLQLLIGNVQQVVVAFADIIFFASKASVVTDGKVEKSHEVLINRARAPGRNERRNVI